MHGASASMSCNLGRRFQVETRMSGFLTRRTLRLASGAFGVENTLVIATTQDSRYLGGGRARDSVSGFGRKVVMLEKILPLLHWAYIAIVALGSLGLYHATSRVNADKDRELARYQADAEVRIEQAKGKALQAEARAAEANARAEQAQLELAKLKQPRTISPEHQVSMIDHLRKYAGQSYSFLAYEDPEAHALVAQIDEILGQAGWKTVPAWKSVIVQQVATSEVGVSAKEGVAVYMGPDYPEGKEPLSVLSNQLSLAGIPCTAYRDPKWGEKEPKTIIIIVGKKPVD